MRNHLPATIHFGDQALAVVDHRGQPWLAARDLAHALGYSDESAVTRLYARNSNEFSADMTCTVKLTAQGGGQARDVRIFSPRGCHLLAMFANTPRAAAFRRWVLDVLEGLAPAPARSLGRNSFKRRGYPLASFALFNAYMRQCREATQRGEELPSIEDVSEDVVNGLVTDMLWGRRWILGFDDSMQPQLTPWPPR